LSGACILAAIADMKDAVLMYKVWNRLLESAKIEGQVGDKLWMLFMETMRAEELIKIIC